MSATFIIFVSILVALVLLILGCPIFVCLGMAGIIGMFLKGGFIQLSLLQTTVFGSISTFTLVAVPLFILMGEVILRSGIGTHLFDAFSRILHRVPGGLAMATVIACAIFGAMCGVSIAAVASIGVIALPEMLKRGYNPKLAAGAVCAPGALAMMIPPSLLFILYGEVARVSVAKLFMAGIVPGILLAFMMCLYIAFCEIISPSGANLQESESLTIKEFFLLIKKVWPSILLIIGVLGSIYLGIATPTESAAIGVLGAYFIAIAVYRTMDWQSFRETLTEAGKITTMIFLVFVGAVIFSQFLNLMRVPDSLAYFISSLHLSPWMKMICIQLMLFFLGMFVDGASMILITTPILLPTIYALNWDPIWFGVLMVANIEMAVITPPVGLNLYALASITDAVDMESILKGTLPYVIVEFLGLLLLIVFPQICLWLPGMMH